VPTALKTQHEYIHQLRNVLGIICEMCYVLISIHIKARIKAYSADFLHHINIKIPILKSYIFSKNIT